MWILNEGRILFQAAKGQGRLPCCEVRFAGILRDHGYSSATAFNGVLEI